MQQREFELTVQGTLSLRNVDRIHRSREAEVGKGQWRLSRATPLQLKAESARAGCPGYCLWPTCFRVQPFSFV